MANATNTGSTLTTDQGKNKTSTSLSTHMVIYVNGNAVGAIQDIKISESRNIQMIDEVGTDGHIDSTPNKSTEISGTCTRIRFDRLRIAEAFSRGFVHASSQAYPFDIVIVDRQKSNVNSQITTVIKNVWISDISYSYDVNNWIVSDSMNWKAETIFSTLSGSGNENVAQGGERAQKFSKVLVEQATDRGENRGSLDASGLIDLGADYPGIF